MAEKVNPYIAGAPVVESSLFFGRDDVFSWVTNNLLGKYVDHILVIHGQRRVGKTSVLKQLPRRLPDNYVQVFLDLQGRISISLDRCLWWMAREISKSLRAHQINFATPDQEAFSQVPDYFESTFIPQLTQALGEKNLLITFDEFDTLDSTAAKDGLARPLMTALQYLMNQPKVALIFSIGSSGRKLENMQAVYTNFFKQALYKKISFLNENDARDLITKPVQGVLEYAPDAIQRIFQITSGHPYFIQLICHELFSTCQKVDRWVVYAHHVEDILDPVIERGTANLKYVWDDATPLGQWILGFLAQSKDPLDEAALAKALNRERVRFAPSDLASELLHLREKDILAHDNHFVVELMRLWMLRNRPIERIREELVETNPIADRFIEIGEEYQEQGEYVLATENFNKALAVDPENIRAWVNLGFTVLKQHSYLKAVEHFTKALKLDDEDVLACNGICQANLALGEEALAKGDIEKATGYYHQVLKYDNEHQEAHHKLRLLNQANENYQQAKMAVKRKNYPRAVSLLKEVIQVSEAYKDSTVLLAQAVSAQKRSSPSWLSWRLASAVLFLAFILLSGWWVASHPGSISNLISKLPFFTQIFSPTPTKTQMVKTARSTPQSTALPPPPWVESSAKPLLDRIAADSPDLAEDFSLSKASWTRLDPNLIIHDGVLEYQGTGLWLALPDFEQVQDFVLQFDFISPSTGVLPRLGISFRGNESANLGPQGYYEFFLEQTEQGKAPTISLRKTGAGIDFRFFEGAAPLLVPGKAIQIMLVVENNQIMLFLDGQPVTFQEDDTWDLGYLRIFLGSTTGESRVRLQIDNFKYWNLEPDWVANFARPVLQSIEGMPPDFQDDFTESKPAWQRQPAFQAGAQIANGVLSYSGPDLNLFLQDLYFGRDFVLEYTVTPRTENLSQFLMINYRILGDSGFYNYGLYYGDPAKDYNNTWGISNQTPSDPKNLSQGEFRKFAINQPNVVTLVVQGDQFGIYTNERPLGYAQDGQFWSGGVHLRFASFDQVAPIQVEIDYLKFWDLDTVEEKEFAKPILLALKDQPLTFFDDFSEIRADWGRLPDGVRIADGGLVMETSDDQDVVLASRLFAAQDFYMRILFTVDYSGEGAEINFGFRRNDGEYDVKLSPNEPTWDWAILKGEDSLRRGEGYSLRGETNELIVLAWGDQFAVFLNGYPMGIIKDATYTGTQNQLQVGVKSGTIRLFIDELHFTDLTQVQLP